MEPEVTPPLNLPGSEPIIPAPIPTVPAVPTPQPESYNLNPPGQLDHLKDWFKAHKRVIITVAAVILVALSIGTYIFIKSNSHKAPAVIKATPSPTPSPMPVPTTKASPLTGVEVENALADRPILGIVIENHPDARPQSGLSAAGVVYEALAEGGITRFLAFFLDQRSGVIGPVRSLRTYFVDWTLEFNSPVAHVGGNADALDLVGPLGVKSLNQFYNGNYYYRANDRFAPHNAYTNSDLMDQLLKRNGEFHPATFKPSPRKADSPPGASATATAATIKIDYSYNGYQVEYRYNPASNSYARFLAGAPHIDRNSSQQIMVKNVVVEYMPTSYGTTRIGEQTVMMGTPGSGQAIVFRDGGAVMGTWSKANHTDRTVLKDSTGTEIPLNKGNTWYSIVPTERTVQY